MPDPRGGGQKGPPPRSDRESYLAPEKKVKRHAKNGTSASLMPACLQSVKMVGH